MTTMQAAVFVTLLFIALAIPFIVRSIVWSHFINQMKKGNAQKEADSLVQEINMKKKELDDLKKQFDVYKAKMEALLISQLELLKDINKEEDE